MTSAPKTVRPTRAAKALRIGALLLGTSALCGVGLTAAFAANESWTGAASANWFVNNNWNPASIPGAGDTVLINSIFNTPFINAATANLAELDIAVTSNAGLTVTGGGALNVTNGGAGTIYLGRNASGTGTLTVTGAGSTVNANTLNIGFSSIGTLSATAGAQLVTQGVVLGANAGSNGAATLSGATSLWNNSAGTMRIGDNGTGSVVVNTGATLSSGDTTLGYTSGSGSLSLADAGTTVSAHSVTVGNNGNGTLSVASGAHLNSSGGVVVGLAQNTVGTATVDGAGSQWNMGANFLVLGRNGSGTLTVQNGATGGSQNIVLGQNTGGSGTFVAQGTGTIWTNTGGNIVVGQDGQGDFEVKAGAIVNSNGVFSVAPDSGATGTALITGANSHLTATNGRIGDLGTGAMTIAAGGLFTGTATFVVGNSAGGTGTLTITDTNSKIDLGTNSIAIGPSGHGTVNLQNGATATTGAVVLGDTGGVGALTVTGTGSAWTASGETDVGGSGQGALHLAAGGVFSVGTILKAGIDAGSTGLVSVDGANSHLTVAGIATIGVSGTGSLAISNGGLADSNGDAVIGDVGGSTGTVTVANANSKWDLHGHTLAIGNHGTGTLAVSDAATLLSDGTSLGAFAGATGTATIQDAGSTWTDTGSLAVGDAGHGTLIIKDGAVVTAAGQTSVGFAANSVGDLQIAGTNSHLTSSGLFLLGSSGTGTLELTAGGRLTEAASAVVGSLIGSTGTATVDGVGTTWDMGTTTLTLGSQGAGTLHVTNGGSVIFSQGSFGSNSTATGIVTVDGVGSSIVASDQINIAASGNATMTISNQGTVSGTNAIIGLSTNSTGTVNLTGVGSSWSNTGNVTVGSSGLGNLNISSGATVNDVNTVLGAANGSGSVRVDGASSFLNSTGTITIGNASGSHAGLFLSNGGIAAALGGMTIASQAGSSGFLVIGADIGNTALVAGTLTSSTPTVTFGAGTGRIIFNHTSANYAFAQNIVGAGEIDQAAGVTHLTAGSVTHSGLVSVTGGSLFVDNTVGATTTNVSSGASLGGTGSLTGVTTIANGGHLVGVQGQTFGTQTLVLNNTSNVDVTLTNPSATALFSATDLTLDGKLNITSAGTFGPGIYRLFDYTNSITDNGLDLGTTPDGTTAADFSIQTDLAGKHVNLIDTAAAQLRFWDGDAGPANNNVVDGGNGTWTTTSMNFTDGSGTSNGVQTPQPGFVVFMGTPGTVTVDDSAGQVGVTGMQFAVDGYTITGGPLQLANAQTTLRVGDGSGASVNYIALISAVLSGTGGLNKTDLGTALLTGVNTYTGLTTISSGTLRLDGAGSIAASSGVVDNGVLQISGVTGTSASIKSLSGNGVVVEGGKTLVLTAASDTFAGSVNGTGGLTVAGGSETITGVQGYTGDTNINSGAALAISGAGSIASSLQVFANGTLDIAAASAPVNIGGLRGSGAVQLGANTLVIHNNGNFGGVISGTGALDVEGGIANLLGANTYTGGTTIGSNAALELGFSSTTGSLIGNVVDNGLFATSRSDNYTFAGNISGTGQFATLGAGMTTLTGTNTYSGGTTILVGTLAGSATSFGSGAIDDHTALIIDQATNGTMANDISNAGSVEKRGVGTVAYTGNGTWTGGTTVSAGTLQVGNGGTTGSITGGVVDNGTLAFNRSDAVTFAGVISGTGGLSQLGTGKTTLTSAETYTGATVISAGTLALSGNGRINGSSGIALSTGATFDISAANGGVSDGTLSGGGNVALGANSLTLTNASGSFGGVISGTGGLVKQGTGTFVLTGANTYTGGTTIAAGTLQIGSGGTTGSIAGNVTDNGTLAFNRSDANTFAGVISGSGGVTQAGTGAETLSGVNTFTGGTKITAGTLVGSATSFGSGAISDNGLLVLDQPGAAALANAISGSGKVTKQGNGTLSLTGANIYTGGTTISAGTLQIGNGGTIGSIVGDITDNAVLSFNRSDAVTEAGVISGTGSVVQAGTGITTLSGVNTYTGGTSISAGTLVGSATSFGSGAIADNGALVIDQPAAATFANVITGTGSFTKQGAGSLNLTGASTLTGPTTVAAGRLAVNGSLANSIVTVQSGATLGGNGTVKGVIAQTGAIVAPGNSIGTLTVAGNYAQASGSTYQVELTSTGQNDRINATGTATIANGAILNVTKTDGGDYVQGTRYTVLTAAGGVNGAYTLSGDLVTAVYGLAAHYDANDVYLDVFRAKKFVDFGTTPNQIATGTALDTLPANGALTHALSNLATDAQVTAALDQVSGEIHASAKTAELEDSRFPREAALGRLSTAFAQGDTDSMHPSLWGQGYGSWGSTDGNGNAASMGRSSRGFLGGVDLPVANTWRVGFLGGYSRASLNVKDRSSSETSDNYHLGAYAGMQDGALGVRFGAAYTWHDVTTQRTVAFTGFNNALAAQYNAGTTQGFGEVGYHVPVAKADLEPFANLAYVSLHTGNIIETGGAAALTGAGNTQNVTFTTLGLRGKYDISLGDTLVGLHADAGWRHAFGNLTPITALSFAGSSAFIVQGVPLAQDGAAYGAGFDVSVAKDVLLGLSYDGQYAPSANDNTIKLNLDWKL
jgi:fibronectin-binding autotransporter adhesin